jgi:hypothetical protein
MTEPNIEKKFNGQEATVKKLLDQQRNLQEKSTEREKKLVSDLEARQADEKRILQNEYAEKERNLVSGLELKYSKDIQDLQARNQDRFRVLVMALLKIKTERDKSLLAVAWIGVGTLVVIAFGGYIHETLSKALTIVTLAGFIGAIVFVGENLKRNGKYLKLAMEGTEAPDSVFEEDDGRPLRYLIFGFSSAVLLGLTIINLPLKTAVPPQSAGLTENKSAALDISTSSKTGIQTVSIVEPISPKTIPAAKTPAASPSRSKGNGGNFMGGEFKE